MKHNFLNRVVATSLKFVRCNSFAAVTFRRLHRNDARWRKCGEICLTFSLTLYNFFSLFCLHYYQLVVDLYFGYFTQDHRKRFDMFHHTFTTHHFCALSEGRGCETVTSNTSRWIDEYFAKKVFVFPQLLLEICF